MLNYKRSKKPMYMESWIERLNAFLEFNEHDILENAGKIKKVVADQLAFAEYEKYHQQRLVQDTKDDFDEFVEKKGLND